MQPQHSLDLESNQHGSYEDGQVHGSQTRILTEGASNRPLARSHSDDNISPATLVGADTSSSNPHPPPDTAAISEKRNMSDQQHAVDDNGVVSGSGPTAQELGQNQNNALRFRANTTTSTGRRSTTYPHNMSRSSTENTANSPNQTFFSRVSTQMSSLMTPVRPVGETPTVSQSIKAIVLSSWINVMLVFIPVSWVLHFIKADDTLIFVFSFLAIIPLAKLLGFATEELALRVGQTIGGLLNATLGNAVELIISIIALAKCHLRVVQSSLVGSILSNLLLVLGMCFFAGGTRFSEQGFMTGAAQLNSSLLTVSVVSVIIPAVFHAALDTSQTDANARASEGDKILKMSRGVSIILLFIYACMLAFQLWSHAHLYDEHGEYSDAPKSVKYPVKPKKPEDQGKKRNFLRFRSNGTQLNRVESPRGESETAGVNAAVSAGAPSTVHTEEEEEEEEIPQLSVVMAVVLLVVVTVFTAFTAEFLVDSIDGLVDNSPLSEEWVGLVLIPIVGNAAEHVTAVTVSVKDKLDLSIGVAVGSSIQISLLVIPLIVVLGWIIGKPLTLLFDPFEAVVLFLSVIAVNYVVADGKSNWLEGMILMNLYVLIATALWFYPGSDPASTLLTCT